MANRAELHMRAAAINATGLNPALDPADHPNDSDLEQQVRFHEKAIAVEEGVAARDIVSQSGEKNVGEWEAAA